MSDESQTLAKNVVDTSYRRLTKITYCLGRKPVVRWSQSENKLNSVKRNEWFNDQMFIEEDNMENKFKFRMVANELRYAAQIGAAVVALVSVGKTLYDGLIGNPDEANVVRWVQFVSVMSTKNPAASIRAAEELWVVLKLDRLPEDTIIVYEDIIKARFPGRAAKLRRAGNAKV